MHRSSSSSASYESATIGDLAHSVLDQQLAVLLAREAGVRSGRDPEDLHDMRVAVRRLRAALKVFALALPSGCRELRGELGWLAQALAEVRDCDVQQAQIQAWCDEAPPEEQAAFQELLRLLEQDRVAARERMLQALDSARFRQLDSTMKEVITTTASPNDQEACIEPARLATTLLKRYWRRLRVGGNGLTLTSSAADLHQLRIRNKRLRDAVEFFAHLYGKPIRPLLRRILELNDALGLHQDAYVASTRLHELGITSGGALALEIRQLLERLERRYELQRQEAAVRALKTYHMIPRKRWSRLNRALKTRRAADDSIASHDVRELAASAPAQRSVEVSPTTSRRKALDIYLIRHATAFARDEVAWPDDSERPLTPKGRRRWQRAARSLGLLASDIMVLLSSPVSRAWESAGMLEQEAGWPAPQRCEALAIQGSPEAVVEALRSYTSGAIALVGHEPNLHELASYLLTGDSASVQLEFRKGGCARLSFVDGVEPGSAVLRWLLLPRALRGLRR